MHRSTITAAQHARCVSRHAPEFGIFSKLGESQEQAIKRLMSAAKRAKNKAETRDFPKFSTGMSTAEYVRRYESMNSGRNIRTMYSGLNEEPCALYEGGTLDFGAEWELVDGLQQDQYSTPDTTAAAQVATVAAIATAQASAATEQPASTEPSTAAAPELCEAVAATAQATAAESAASTTTSQAAPITTATAKPAQSDFAAKLHANRQAIVSHYTKPDALTGSPSGQANMMRSKNGAAVAWTWTDAQGFARAIAWLGNSTKPYSGTNGKVGTAYRFKTQEGRRRWLADLIDKASHIEKRKAETAAKKAAGHHLKVGDVLCSSWGHEQTNVDFYQVTAAIGATLVEVRKIDKECSHTTDMTGQAVPIVNKFTSEAKRYKVSTYDGRSIKIASYARAYLIEPVEVAPGVRVFKPENWTSYA